MQLEKQCCTLEQGKILKDLGVREDRNLHHWLSTGTGSGYMISGTACEGLPPADWGLCYPAYTVAELGLACRDCISGSTKDNRFYATPDEYADYDLDSVIEDGADPLPCYVERDTQAIALADLLIWLLKTGLLTADEVNKRFSK